METAGREQTTGNTSSTPPAGLVLTRDLIFATKIRSTADALGLQLTVAATAEQVLETAAAMPVRLVVIDLGHPDVKPAELLLALRTLAGPSLKIVAFGSHVDTARLDEARAAGCDDVMPRSRFSATLPELLRRYLAEN